MSARLTLEFLDDGSMTYEHRLSKDSDERRTTDLPALNLMDVTVVKIAAGTDMGTTHEMWVMTAETARKIKERLESKPVTVWSTWTDKGSGWVHSTEDSK